MSHSRTRRVPRTLLGFAVALVVVGVGLSLVGWRRILADLAGTDLPVFALGLVLVVVAFFCWSETVRQLLEATGHEVSGLRYRAAFLAGEFAKQVVPLGHSAGPAFVAYTVSSQSEADYGETFAATMVAEFVNIAASILLATAGMAVLLSQRPNDPVLVALAGGLALATAALFSVGLLVVYRRRLLRRVVSVPVGLVRATVGRVSERVRTATAPAAMDARFEAFYGSFDRVAGDRRQLLIGGAFALLGWASFVLPLVTSFEALGHPFPATLALFAIPVVSLVNVVPTPGGLGGFELALTVVVSGITGLDVEASAAGVLLYRTSNYWFVLLLGGFASAYLSVGVAEVAAEADLPQRVESD